MKPSPFWLLAGGLGFAFLITSGRAKAIYDVVTKPIEAPIPDDAMCKRLYGPDYAWSVVEGKCVLHAIS